MKRLWISVTFGLLLASATRADGFFFYSYDQFNTNGSVFTYFSNIEYESMSVGQIKSAVSDYLAAKPANIGIKSYGAPYVEGDSNLDDLKAERQRQVAYARSVTSGRDKVYEVSAVWSSIRNYYEESRRAPVTSNPYDSSTSVDAGPIFAVMLYIAIPVVIVLLAAALVSGP